jgi:hypothetical protein
MGETESKPSVAKAKTLKLQRIFELPESEDSELSLKPLNSNSELNSGGHELDS